MRRKKSSAAQAASASAVPSPPQTVPVTGDLALRGPLVPVAGRDYTLCLPGEHLSYSQIETYLRCPRRYYHQYVLGEKGVYSSALAEGQAMTKTLEKTCRVFLIFGSHLPLSDLLASHHEALMQDFGAIEEWGEEDHRELLLERGAVFLTKLHESGMPLTPEPGGVEAELRAIIAGVPVLGYADLIEAGQVIDYKVVKTDRYLDVDRSLQLSLYCYMTGKPSAGYLVFRKEKRDYTFVSSPRKPISRAWVEFTVANVARSISAGSFPPCNPAENKLCSARWCPAWKSCYGSMGGK